MSYEAEQTRRAGKRGADSPANKKKNDQPESRLQQAIVSILGIWADTHDAPHLNWVYHVPNGGKRSGPGRFILSAEGVRPGISDLVYPFPGPNGYNGAYQELKSPTGVLRPSQKEFLTFAHSQGGACSVAKTLIDALVFWRWYFGLRISDGTLYNQATLVSSGVALGDIEGAAVLWTPSGPEEVF